MRGLQVQDVRLIRVAYGKRYFKSFKNIENPKFDKKKKK